MQGSNNVIKTKRLQKVSGKETFPSTYNLENLDCYIERARPEVAIAFTDINAFYVFLCVIDGEHDINISDLVEDSASNTYIVKGILPYENNTDVPNHTELIMIKKSDGN